MQLELFNDLPAANPSEDLPEQAAPQTEDPDPQANLAFNYEG